MASVDRFDTPLGPFTIVVDEQGRLCRAGFEVGPVEAEPVANPHGLSAAIRAYFAGDLHALDGLPVAAEGTDFQRAVWDALREIPCGETRSYGDIARRLGKPGAMRAVGLANNRNPVGVVVPCHRVIGADGTLVGYGGGLVRKRWLLAHEARQLDLLAPPPR